MDGSSSESDLSYNPLYNLACRSWTVVDNLLDTNVSSELEDGPSTPAGADPNSGYAEDKEESTISSDEESFEIIPEDRNELNECKVDHPWESHKISTISNESGDDYQNAEALPSITEAKRKRNPSVPNVYLHLAFALYLSLATVVGLGLGIGHFLGLDKECAVPQKPPPSLLLSLQEENQLLKYHLDHLLTVVRCHHSNVAVYNCISNYVTFLRRPGIADSSEQAESMLDLLGSKRDIYSKCVMMGEVNPMHAVKDSTATPLQNEEEKSNLGQKMVQESLDITINTSKMCVGPGCLENEDILLTETCEINKQDYKNNDNKYQIKTETQFELNKDEGHHDNVNKPTSFENMSNKKISPGEDLMWKVSGSNEEEIQVGRIKATIVQEDPNLVEDIENNNMKKNNKGRKIKNYINTHNESNSNNYNDWPDKGKIQDKRNIVVSKYPVDENTSNQYKEQTQPKCSNINFDKHRNNREYFETHYAGQKYPNQDKCHQDRLSKQNYYEKQHDPKMVQGKKCAKQIDAIKCRSKNIEARSNIRGDNIKQKSNIRSDNIEQNSNIRSDNIEQNSNIRSDTPEQNSNIRSDKIDKNSNIRSDNIEQNSNIRSDNIEQNSNISGEWFHMRGDGRADLRNNARRSEWLFARAEARHKSRTNQVSYQEKVILKIKKLIPKHILKIIISLLKRIRRNEHISKLLSLFLPKEHTSTIL